MGGYNSGRPASYAVIDSQRRLDIRALRRGRCLAPGTSGVWTWRQEGEPCGSVSYRGLDDGTMALEYSVWNNEDERELVEITIQTRSYPCRYGGSRSYFSCPYCRRRCEVVVMTTNGRHWGCRRCLPVRYASQRLSPADRMQRRADTLYERAGTDHGEGFVVKRKWMRWRTFNRLMNRANALSTGADAAFLWRLRRFGFDAPDELLK